MNSIKRSSALMLLIVGGALFCLLQLYDNKREKKAQQNIVDSNALRNAFGVPIIEKHWVKRNIGDSREKWYDGVPGIESNGPIHLHKEIVYGSNWIVNENDAFHFEFSDSVQYRLIISHRYYAVDSSFKRTESKLIIYEPEKFPPSHSQALSKEQADSVLAVWSLNY